MAKQIPSRLADELGDSFYRSEAKIHPRETSGTFQRLRLIALVWLLGMFYLFPWLNYDHRKAVLFDLPARKFYVFAFNFWPQDFIFLTLLLAIAALSLFFFTTLAGRVWCGYACPQTVWTEVFFMMERWCEGDRLQRIKLDASPWTWNKWRRRGGKYVLFALFSLWTGLSFVGFFSPMRELAPRALMFDASGWETFWILFYGLATFGNAGFLREQVCKYMCPYARFQSAMFDRNTRLIAYDNRRGEIRGARKRGALLSVLERARGLLSIAEANEHSLAAREVDGTSDAAKHKPQDLSQLGDCIDCNICVQVCPTGIDIRNGLQYECITCGACIDACDQVMDKLNYPRGLIRYTSLNALEGKPSRILRARVFIYGSILLGLISAFLYGITHRNALTVDVLHDRQALYRVESNLIANDYVLKIANKRTHAVVIVIRTPAAQLPQLQAPLSLNLPAESVQAVPITLTAAPGIASRSRVELLISERTDAGHESAAQPAPVRIIESMFFAPGL